jgi:hypothetical protein
MAHPTQSVQVQRRLNLGSLHSSAVAKKTAEALHFKRYDTLQVTFETPLQRRHVLPVSNSVPTWDPTPHIVLTLHRLSAY